MLVLSRKQGESIQIGDDIRVTVVLLDSGKVRIGIEAPRTTRIIREELLARDAIRADEPVCVTQQ